MHVNDITLEVRAPSDCDIIETTRHMSLFLAPYAGDEAAIRLTIRAGPVAAIEATACGLPDDDAFEELKQELFACFGRKYDVHVRERRLGKEYEVRLPRLLLN